MHLDFVRAPAGFDDQPSGFVRPRADFVRASAGFGLMPVGLVRASAGFILMPVDSVRIPADFVLTPVGFVSTSAGSLAECSILATRLPKDKIQASTTAPAAVHGAESIV